MLLLDIIPRRIPRNLPDTLRRVKKVIVDTIQPSGKTEVPDTIDSVTSTQESANVVVNNLGTGDGGSSAAQLADVIPPPSTYSMASDDWTTTLLTVLAVIAALSLCLHFAFRYRRTHKDAN